MNISVCEIAQLIKNTTDPRDCPNDLTIVFRYNIPGTDIFVDAGSVGYPTKTNDAGDVEFADSSRLGDWAIDQLTTAGYYVADVTDVVMTDRDFYIVFIMRSC